MGALWRTEALVRTGRGTRVEKDDMTTVPRCVPPPPAAQPQHRLASSGVRHFPVLLLRVQVHGWRINLQLCASLSSLTIHRITVHAGLMAEEKGPPIRPLRVLPAVLLGVGPGGEKSEKGGSTRHGGV
jgi:hypothetical protein